MSMELQRVLSWSFSNIFLMLFIFVFLPLRYSKLRTAVYCLITVISVSFLDYIRIVGMKSSLLPSFIVMVTQIIIVQGTAFYISEERDGKAVFTGMSASNYVMAGNICGEITFYLTGHKVLSYLLAYLVYLVLLLLLVRYVRKPYKKLMEADIPVFHRLCAIPALFYVTVTLFCFYPRPLYMHPVNIPGALGLLLTMAVAYIVTFHSIESINRQSEQRWNIVALESYARGLELQYGRMEEAQQDLKILRHDLRHYIAAVSVLLEEGKTNEIRSILNEISDTVDESSIVNYCENPIINSIMCSMAAQAVRDSIVLDVSMSIPGELPFSSARLGAVLANLLENAILSVREQALEERRIKILARCNDKHLIIEVINPCHAAVKFDRESGLPITSRGKGHGLGLQGVSDFAQNHHAVFDCGVKEGIFTARLLVYM